MVTIAKQETIAIDPQKAKHFLRLAAEIKRAKQPISELFDLIDANKEYALLAVLNKKVLEIKDDYGWRIVDQIASRAHYSSVITLLQIAMVNEGYKNLLIKCAGDDGTTPYVMAMVNLQEQGVNTTLYHGLVSKGALR